MTTGTTSLPLHHSEPPAGPLKNSNSDFYSLFFTRNVHTHTHTPTSKWSVWPFFWWWLVLTRQCRKMLLKTHTFVIRNGDIKLLSRLPYLKFPLKESEEKWWSCCWFPPGPEGPERPAGLARACCWFWPQAAQEWQTEQAGLTEMDLLVMQTRPEPNPDESGP